jgi:hypothetical protein
MCGGLATGRKKKLKAKRAQGNFWSTVTETPWFLQFLVSANFSRLASYNSVELTT